MTKLFKRKLEQFTEVGYLNQPWRFKFKNPSVFMLRDFYNIDDNGNLSYCDVKDLSKRCANMFEETRDNISEINYFQEDQGEMKTYRVVNCRSFRFLTMCRLFILHQIEFNQILSGKSCFAKTEDGEIVVDGFELMMRMRVALNLLAEDKDIVQAIKNIELSGRHLSRVNWMCIFSFLLFNKRIVRFILKMDDWQSKVRKFDNEKRRIEVTECSVCLYGQKETRFGPCFKSFGYDLVEGHTITTINQELMARKFDGISYCVPIWGEHHYVDKPVYNNNLLHHIHVFDEHFHWRRIEEGLFEFEEYGLTVSFTRKELIIIGLFVHMIKQELLDYFDFGLQYYCLYPVDNLFDGFGDSLGVFLVFWIVHANINKITNNSNDSLYTHLFSYYNIINGDGGVCKNYQSRITEDLKFIIVKDWKYFNLNNFGLIAWNKFKIELVKKLKLHGCSCGTCYDLNYPSI